jgi:hypothetical protein
LVVIGGDAVDPERMSTLRAARWLVPWVCLFLLTATLAHAADQALVQALADRSTMREAQAEATMHWVVLSSMEAQPDPRSVTCLMPVDRVAADVLTVRSVDFDAMMAELCISRRPTSGR